MELCKGYGYKTYAPYLDLDTTGLYAAAHTVLLAHGKVYRMYEKMFKAKQKGEPAIVRYRATPPLFARYTTKREQSFH